MGGVALELVLPNISLHSAVPCASSPSHAYNLLVCRSFLHFLATYIMFSKSVKCPGPWASLDVVCIFRIAETPGVRWQSSRHSRGFLPISF